MPLVPPALPSEFPGRSSDVIGMVRKSLAEDAVILMEIHHVSRFEAYTDTEGMDGAGGFIMIGGTVLEFKFPLRHLHLLNPVAEMARRSDAFQQDSNNEARGSKRKRPFFVNKEPGEESDSQPQRSSRVSAVSGEPPRSLARKPSFSESYLSPFVLVVLQDDASGTSGGAG